MTSPSITDAAAPYREKPHPWTNAPQHGSHPDGRFLQLSVGQRPAVPSPGSAPTAAHLADTHRGFPTGDAVPSRVTSRQRSSVLATCPLPPLGRTLPVPHPTGSRSPGPPQYSRLMHLCEPVALLQPWQHCPPQTLTLREEQTGATVRRGSPQPPAPARPGRETKGREEWEAARSRGGRGVSAGPPVARSTPRVPDGSGRVTARGAARGAERGTARHGTRGTLPRQRRQRVLLAGRRAAAVAVGSRRRLGPRAEAGRLGEGGGGVGVTLPDGAQAELHSRASRFAHPPRALRGAVARVELHVKGALLLLPREEGRALLLPAGSRARLAGVQHVGDPSQPALLGSGERRGQQRPGAQEEAPSDPSHLCGRSPRRLRDPRRPGGRRARRGAGPSSSRRPQPAEGPGRESAPSRPRPPRAVRGVQRPAEREHIAGERRRCERRAGKGGGAGGGSDAEQMRAAPGSARSVSRPGLKKRL